MSPSLLSRFQGAICGSLLGEASASDNFKLEPQTLSLESQLGLKLLENLRGPHPSLEPLGEQWQSLSSSSSLALATLPLAIFCHDNLTRFREQVSRLVAPGQLPAPDLGEVFLWGGAIAAILQGRPLPRKGELARDTPLAIALSCFGDTPEDFPLTVRRSALRGGRASLTAALAGALAGAHNGLAGLPPHWRLAFQSGEIGPRTGRQVSQLFCLWTGACQRQDSHQLSRAAIATSPTLQPRPSLKVISQRGEMSSG